MCGFETLKVLNQKVYIPRITHIVLYKVINTTQQKMYTQEELETEYERGYQNGYEHGWDIGFDSGKESE